MGPPTTAKSPLWLTPPARVPSGVLRANVPIGETEYVMGTAGTAVIVNSSEPEELSRLATRVLVIMPAWNERACIGNTVREVIDLGRNYDVLVVDDCSEDGTPELAEAAGAHVLRLPFNLGVGGAMRAGFKYAHRMGYDAVVQVDADANAKLAEALDVTVVPTLVLVRGEKVLGRLEGRVTGSEIADLIGPHVEGAGPEIALGRAPGRR